MLLKDKVAVITGGARGIGKEIASLFIQEGAVSVVWDVDEEALKGIKEEFKRQIYTQKADITDFNATADLTDKILDKFGRIDILVNNAGITRDGLLLRMKEFDWDAVINVNLKGVFVCTKAVSKIMMKQRSGRIVNIGSIVGLMGNPGQANYSASKAGVIGLTKTSAKELASRGINVNAVAPGFIKTKMTESLPEEVKEKMFLQIPKGTFGVPQDVAKAVLFFSSSLSDYITGQVLVVDGGMYM